MTEIVHVNHDADLLSPDARKILNAVVEIGRANPSLEEHCVEIPALCAVAGLPPDIGPKYVLELLLEAQKTLIEIELIDTDHPDDEGAWASISVLGTISVSETNVWFSLNTGGHVGDGYLPKLSQVLLAGNG